MRGRLIGALRGHLVDIPCNEMHLGGPRVSPRSVFCHPLSPHPLRFRSGQDHIAGRRLDEKISTARVPILGGSCIFDAGDSATTREASPA